MHEKGHAHHVQIINRSMLSVIRSIHPRRGCKRGQLGASLSFHSAIARFEMIHRGIGFSGTIKLSPIAMQEVALVSLMLCDAEPYSYIQRPPFSAARRFKAISFLDHLHPTTSSSQARRPSKTSSYTWPEKPSTAGDQGNTTWA